MKRLIDFFFHPFLWCLPFLFLVVVNIGLMAQYGVYEADFAFEARDRAYSSLNVFFFSLLFLCSMTVFSRLKYSRMSRVYLSFCVIFSAYGVGEFINRVLWFPAYVEVNGLLATVKGMMYPLFFLFNHVPLYVLVFEEKGNKYLNMFLSLQAVHVFLWLIHYGLQLAHPNPYDPFEVIPNLYYPTRGLMILAYIILLLGFLREK